MNRWSESKGLYRTVFTLLILAILYFLFQIRPILGVVADFLGTIFIPFFLAMIISYLLNPIVNVLAVRKVPRSIAVLLIYCVFITCVVILIMNMVPLIQHQLKELIEHFPQWNAQIQQMIKEYSDQGREWLPLSIQTGVEDSLRHLESGLGDVVAKFMNGIGTTINQVFLAFVIPFIAFYMMKDVHQIENRVLRWLPRNRRSEMVRLFQNIDQALGNYIRGQFLVCMVIGILAYIGYLIIGMPYALLLASFVSLFNIIPYLGPFLGAIPALLVALAFSPKMMVGVVVVNMVIQMLEGNVISPQIVGRSLHLHPIMIIFALIVGDELGGLIGLILAVPVFAVGKVVIEHVLEHYIQRKTE
ncbi:Predicted PurR-regulated permease PerM [Thermoactinomyces sp. DSM 45891]|uniref:AI-2E family transporter n=1 Tax=Thermoactinomyces sp. DSM 45891 TaxID=1761907 RepID=UPI0009170ED1|nr:AI-2E family transporter [Thermoactinomyces sp. DSM 45891]SFX46408.1 Predicted PurR-regulated permease PerM [Thermoactinomyces sp. DSM 45891]